MKSLRYVIYLSMVAVYALASTFLAMDAHHALSWPQRIFLWFVLASSTLGVAMSSCPCLSCAAKRARVEEAKKL